MASVTDKILKGKGYAEFSTNAMLDAGTGGMFGWAPNLRDWISDQAYVRRNIIPIMLDYPKFFREMPKSEYWIRALKNMMEVSAQSIEGLNAGGTLEFEQHPVGGNGQMMDEPTDAKDNVTTVTYTWVEKNGMPISTLLRLWRDYGIMHPQTKYALINTIAGANIPEVYTPDWYTCSMLFIEPDPTHRYVIRSWVGVNMMPKSIGDLTGKLDKTTANEMLTLSIEFSGFFESSYGTNVYAQSVLDKINVVRANPYTRASFVDQINPDIEAVAKGYKESVENTKS